MPASNEQLDQWLSDLAAGSRESLRALYDELRTPIFRYALAMVHHIQTAEDIAQDTFLELIHSVKHYRRKGNPRAWIFSIVRNQSIDALKISGRNMPLCESAQTENFHDEVEDSMEVLRILAKLEPQEREIVSMYVFGGLKQTEIAKVLKLPYITVRAKYGYAIKKLRRQMERSADNER
jgi:RNA polymerase sigma-70 factor (ECF subfamily)